MVAETFFGTPPVFEHYLVGMKSHQRASGYISRSMVSAVNRVGALTVAVNVPPSLNVSLKV